MMQNNSYKAQSKGNAGENEVSRILSGFNRKQYVVINNVLLKKPFSYDGDIPTVQIDHIVVSIYGIFTVETKNYSGAIYGSEDAKTWAIFLGGKKYQMQNPLRQNYAHSKTLQSLLTDNSVELGISNANFAISQIIAFSKEADLRKVEVTGADVVHFGQIPDVILRKSQRQCLSYEQMEAIASFINSKNIYSPEKMREHVEAILRKKEEPVRQKNSWDLNVGNNYNNSQEKYEYIPDYDNRYIEPRTYQQFESQNENQKYSKNSGSKALLIVTLVIVGIVILFFVFCCCGPSLFSKLLKLGNSQNNNQNNSIVSTITDDLVTSRSQIGEAFVLELKNKAEDEVNNYIKTNTKEETNYRDVLDSPEYLGECFAYDDLNENELFFVYKIANETEAIDNVNLRKYTKDRPIFIYVGFKNIVTRNDGSFSYDNSLVEFPTVQVSDFTSKSIYNTNNYKFIHSGYPFLSDLFDDIESGFRKTEFNPEKELLVKNNHIDELNITDYADYFGHASFWNVGGYIDDSGEEYNSCIMAYYHNAFTDPTCVDYRIGTEYNTLSFKYTTNPSLYGDNLVMHISAIDKDTFEVFYNSEDIIKGQTGEAVIDVTNHKNIRLQLVATEGFVGQVFIKDVELSNNTD